MIGIFDSGVGGLTVAQAIEQLCPGYPIIYFGDIARTPYGSKSKETIIKYSMENSEFLIAHGAKMIVIACNSAASTSIETLRQHFTIPIIDVIEPAVNQAVKKSRSKRIGVIGTKATIKSLVYEDKITELAPDTKIIPRACPLFVPLVEEGWLDKRESKMIARRYLHPIRNQQVDTLILACTHYPILKHIIGPRIGRKTSLIDSSVEVAKEVQRYLENNADFAQSVYNEKTRSRFFVSDITETAIMLANKIFNREINLELTNA